MDEEYADPGEDDPDDEAELCAAEDDRQHRWIASVLADDVNGPHGESERRVVGEYVKAAVEGHGPLGGEMPGEVAAMYASCLADAAESLAKQLRNGPPRDFT